MFFLCLLKILGLKKHGLWNMKYITNGFGLSSFDRSLTFLDVQALLLLLRFQDSVVEFPEFKAAYEDLGKPKPGEEHVAVKVKHESDGSDNPRTMVSAADEICGLCFLVKKAKGQRPLGDDSYSYISYFLWGFT